MFLQSRLPLMHSIAPLTNSIEILVRNQLITWLYWRFLFLATLVHSVRITCSVSLPEPPYTLNTKGLKVPCSSWMTRWLQAFFFSFSLTSKFFWSSDFRWVWAKGLKTLTSKNAFCPSCQKLLTLISARALSALLAESGSNSPVCEGHQLRFTGHVIVHFTDYVGEEISKQIVSLVDKTSFGTIQSMICIESLTTWTRGWQSLKGPTVPETDCIAEFALVQVELFCI